jgi:hypothetical protein
VFHATALLRSRLCLKLQLWRSRDGDWSILTEKYGAKMEILESRLQWSILTAEPPILLGHVTLARLLNSWFVRFRALARTIAAIQSVLLVCCAGLPAYAQGVIETIVGKDFAFTGDGQPAISVPLGGMLGIATDSQGNVYGSGPRKPSGRENGP